MKQYKKITILSVLLFSMIFSLSANAISNEKNDGITLSQLFKEYDDDCYDNENIHPFFTDFKLPENLDIDEISERLIMDELENFKYEFTFEEGKNLKKYMQFFESQEFDNSILHFSNTSNEEKLRYGNLIETTLNIHENLSISDNIVVVSTAHLAKNEAKKNFSDYWDSAQHFIWNYNLVKLLGYNKAKIATNNHEWGITMINPMINYYKRIYEKYKKMHYSDDKAKEKALYKTLVYIPKFKRDSTKILKENYRIFKKFFIDDCIMDFWNNHHGREYAKRNFKSATDAFKDAAFTKKILVLDSKPISKNLKESQRRKVWSNKWYIN